MHLILQWMWTKYTAGTDVKANLVMEALKDILDIKDIHRMALI